MKYEITTRVNGHITYREGWGGLESLHAVATPEQDHALRAAMKAQAAA